GTAVSFLIFFLALLWTFFSGAATYWAILAALIAFIFSSMKKGFTFREVWAMGWKEMPKAFIVLRVILFVGILTGLLRSCGTIACFVYSGTRILPPQLFVLLSFLICTLLSYLLGSSFAVCSTAGVILMVFARSGGVSIPVAAGAIISGVYFGDRGAPTSSCAALVAAVTETKVTDNVKWMHKTALVPYAIILVLYTALSFRHPLSSLDQGVLSTIEETFVLHPVVLLPALLILILPFLKCRIWVSMGISALSALLVSVLFQGYSLLACMRFLTFGFTSEAMESLTGGGIVSMKSVLILIPAASMLSGILGGTGVLDAAQSAVEKMAGRIGKLPSMFVLSSLSAMVFCNQTVSVMLSHQMLKGVYAKEGREKTEMAIDIENTGVTLSGLVPWSIACSVPLSILGADLRALPYEFLLYLIPLCYLGLKQFYFPSK
ncbi:MAG: hypothetical protein KBS81_09355, partial [Spirochaetales bacterium]|nr:hypothetical protein [Candidatus Physcosoma equi]